jgi:hypothetical protein
VSEEAEMETRGLRALVAPIGGVVMVGSLWGLAHADTNDVPDLTTLRGVWEECPVASSSADEVGDSGDYCLDGVELDLGPRSAVGTARAQFDFDGDGSLETLAEEFAGLVGQSVILEVERDDADADVFVINGMKYRDPTTARPPWTAAPSGAPRPSPAAGGAPDGRRPVVTSMTGTWSECWEEYCLDDVVLDLGPRWYRAATQAPADLDGDGSIETLAAELAGLVGRTVTLSVALDGGSAEVLEIDGVVYRDVAVARPPWAGGPLMTTEPAGSGRPPTSVPPFQDTVPPEGAPPQAVPPEGEPPQDVPSRTVQSAKPESVTTGPPPDVATGKPTDSPTGPPPNAPTGGTRQP